MGNKPPGAGRKDKRVIYRVRCTLASDPAKDGECVELDPANVEVQLYTDGGGVLPTVPFYGILPGGTHTHEIASDNRGHVSFCEVALRRGSGAGSATCVTLESVEVVEHGAAATATTRFVHASPIDVGTAVAVSVMLEPSARCVTQASFTYDYVPYSASAQTFAVPVASEAGANSPLPQSPHASRARRVVGGPSDGDDLA